MHLALEEVSASYLGCHVLQGTHNMHLDTLQGLLITMAGYVIQNRRMMVFSISIDANKDYRTKKRQHLMRFPGYRSLALGIINDARFDHPPRMRVMRQRLDVEFRLWQRVIRRLHSSIMAGTHPEQISHQAY